MKKIKPIKKWLIYYETIRSNYLIKKYKTERISQVQKRYLTGLLKIILMNLQYLAWIRNQAIVQ